MSVAELSIPELIEAYARGASVLQAAIAGMSDAEIAARPVAGKWSTLEVICHIADFEPVYADRMKRVIAEENPPLMSGDPDLFLKHLAYDARDAAGEIAVIDSVRQQMARILRTLPGEAFARVGTHSRDGAVSLETLLRRITSHIPHHLKFIAEKRAALQIAKG
jgi:hypothetical protein